MLARSISPTSPYKAQGSISVRWAMGIIMMTNGKLWMRRIIGVFLDVCLILEMWRWAQRRQNSKQLPKILWWQWYILQRQVPPSPYHMFWDLGQNSYFWYSNFEKVKCSILGPVLSLPGQKVSKYFMIRMILNQKNTIGDGGSTAL